MVQGKHLLLVEDDTATHEVLTLLLEAEGWRVTAVENGEAALAADLLPALALCDLHLPGICGEALAGALRKRWPAAVLLAMSASTRENADEGYDGMVLKPFAPRLIETAWRDIMALRKEATAALQSQGSLSAASTPLPVKSEDVDDPAPILDEETFLKLEQGMGHVRLQQFFAFALGDAGDRLDRMDAAIATRDGAVFAREAHALKGSSGMMGARQVWRLASDAEMEGLTGDSAEKVLQLRTAIGALRLMLETLFPA